MEIDQQVLSSTKGPMDMYYKRGPILKRKRNANDKKDSDKYRKELRDHVVQLFGRWMYDSGITFNVIKYESLQDAVEAIGQYGPEMKAPSYYEVRAKCLNKKKQETEKLVEEMWRRPRKMVGSYFMDIVDVSSYSKIGTKVCELLSKYIDKIGLENVVQVVTDNASENVKAGKMLEINYPHLFWTPCAAHCLDLMFEDIFKIDRFRVTIERAIKVNGYIYNRTKVLNIMRKFTNNKEMVRLAKTRFATGFLTLKRFKEEKANLIALFNSQEWRDSNYSKEILGKNIKRILGML
ncbi:hypothetical protein LIER_35438 [Lithospermum erythrorhizon]|uniref:DUF659 domain-containing protein n=1 Tax=Lithospermum erythrorhizon TaxID=34254 RepID=A0AAV3NS46_LITER